MPTPTPPSSENIRISHMETLVKDHEIRIRDLTRDSAIQEERGRNIEMDMKEIKVKTEELNKSLVKTKQDVISSNVKIAVILGLGLGAANLIIAIIITKVLG